MARKIVSNILLFSFAFLNAIINNLLMLLAKELIKEGADDKAINSFGYTSLYIATEISKEMAKLLLDNKANINDHDYIKGWTPLSLSYNLAISKR